MKLFIVPTPIGNLEDITLRALKILKEADLILAENTRTTGNLLKHFSIETKMLSYHVYNEHKMVKQIAERIACKEKIALVSNAGTPGISDPGFLLVRECIRNGIEVECFPGATAFVPALINSGLPCETFVFVGFLPRRKGRRKKLESLKDEERTMIFYESPFRLVRTLEEFSIVFGKERRASVSRELTKIYEETKRGTIEELLSYFRAKTIKGEIVLVVEGK